MERIWACDVKMKYPKQWIVLVNTSWGPVNKIFGDVYLVTSDKKEAYSTAKSLGNSMGNLMIVEGFDDSPQIGGFTVYAPNNNTVHSM
jgi:hypothetical protein